MKKTILLLITMSLLSGCSQAPNHIVDNGISIAVPHQTEEPSISPPVSSEMTSPDINNTRIVKQSHNKEFFYSLNIDDSTQIIVDAKIDTSNVTKVSLYEYIPQKITDEQRISLFEVYFNDQSDEVCHNTVGYSDSWYLKTDNDYYLFGYGRGISPIDEPVYTLRNANIETHAFDRNMLSSLDDTMISLSDAFKKCTPIISAIEKSKKYEADWIRPFPLPESTDGKGFFWITYRQIIDGMPVTANFDLRFLVTESEIIQIYGTLYDIKEISLNGLIISPESALDSLRKHSSLINTNNLGTDDIFPDTIPISQISLEYLVLRGSDFSYVITPVWRFEIGENEDQRLMYRDRILAVNAITGQIIIDRRGRSM